MVSINSKKIMFQKHGTLPLLFFNLWRYFIHPIFDKT